MGSFTHIPLEQGLRHYSQDCCDTCQYPFTHIPLEQGLRLVVPYLDPTVFAFTHIPLEQGLRR